jgi:hypothetical protein
VVVLLALFQPVPVAESYSSAESGSFWNVYVSVYLGISAPVHLTENFALPTAAQAGSMEPPGARTLLGKSMRTSVRWKAGAPEKFSLG